MLSFRLIRQTLGILVFAFLLAPEAGRAQVAKAKNVKIPTIDGVTLNANFWVGGGKGGATVILLHNFDKTGGDSQKDGWNALAENLQKAGHSVLSFDFRGHGQSLTVEPAKFWSPEFAYNMAILRPKRDKEGKYPETITTADLTAAYYPFLVNDIAAVRAYLDRQNDAGNINTKNVIVIGAGQGATLGALWMETEMKRRQAEPKIANVTVAQAAKLPANVFDFKNPTGKDLAAGIFLDISPTLDGKEMPIHTWLKDVGKENKVPLVFLYGTQDAAAKKVSVDLLSSISPNYKVGGMEEWPKELPFTGEKGIPNTKLKGSQLLTADLPTEGLIATYTNRLLEKRTIIAHEIQGFDKSPAFWVFPTGMIPVRTKPTEDAPRPIPLGSFGIR
jgi:pimeloyl-ACP methyl ester carboxylesterase